MEMYEAKILFQAISEADAQSVMDDIYDVICRGHGKGKEHVCRFDFVATHGPQGWSEEADAEQ